MVKGLLNEIVLLLQYLIDNEEVEYWPVIETVGFFEGQARLC